MVEEQALGTPGSGADGTRFVLVRTSHRGNIGAAARAIKVMGFGDLVLVAPRHGPQVLGDDETLALASGATDVLARARCVDTLDEALVGITHVCATAMTPRDFGPPVAAPRDHLPALAAPVIAGRERVAFVFGNERHGMANTDVWRAHVCLSIPTAPGYGSLNLAQAVQLLAYEWRQQLGAAPVVARTAAVPPASVDEVEGTLAHWREVLVAIGFLDPEAPKKLMPRLQTLLNRARLTREEVHILRGIARAVDGARTAARREPPPSVD